MNNLLESINLNKEYQDFIDKRDILVNKVLDKMTDWESFFEYYSILKEILPIGEWIHNCPDSISHYIRTKDYLNKETTFYYDSICYQIELDDEEYFTDVLLNEIKDYISENMICGTIYDW